MGWVFREWAHATEIYLIGDFNDWKESPKYQLKKDKGHRNWEIKLRGNALKHGDLYKLKIHWKGGCGERISGMVPPRGTGRTDQNLQCASLGA